MTRRSCPVCPDEPVDLDDPVNPAHYTNGAMECIDAIEGLELDFHEAQVLKYICRWKYKNGLVDLRKAAWYLNRLIEISPDDA